MTNFVSGCGILLRDVRYRCDCEVLRSSRYQNRVACISKELVFTHGSSTYRDLTLS